MKNIKTQESLKQYRVGEDAPRPAPPQDEMPEDVSRWLYTHGGISTKHMGALTPEGTTPSASPVPRTSQESRTPQEMSMPPASVPATATSPTRQETYSSVPAFNIMGAPANWLSKKLMPKKSYKVEDPEYLKDEQPMSEERAIEAIQSGEVGAQEFLDNMLLQGPGVEHLYSDDFHRWANRVASRQLTTAERIAAGEKTSIEMNIEKLNKEIEGLESKLSPRGMMSRIAGHTLPVVGLFQGSGPSRTERLKMEADLKRKKRIRDRMIGGARTYNLPGTGTKKEREQRALIDKIREKYESL